MARIIRSKADKPNEQLTEQPVKGSEGNRAWLQRHGDADGVILIGGTSMADFRVRVAQSPLRGDMLPSLWSLCGVLVGDGKFASVPLDLRQGTNAGAIDDVSAIPPTNAVRMCSLDDYDDPKRYPNIAIVRFAKKHDDAHKDIARVQSDRSILDLPALMLPWLGYVWGTAGATNPLLQGIGLPSAAFVETVFAMASFELTPGLSSTSSCPEALWQSAKWWTDFYSSTTAAPKVSRAKAKNTQGGDNAARAVGMIPQGTYTLRQPAAAIVL